MFHQAPVDIRLYPIVTWVPFEDSIPVMVYFEQQRHVQWADNIQGSAGQSPSPVTRSRSEQVAFNAAARKDDREVI